MSFRDQFINLLSYIRQPKKRALLRICFKLFDKEGIEIGGPSEFFKLRGYFPVYSLAKRVDGVNFSNETIWEGSLSEGQNYHYDRGKNGFQYIAEGTDLAKIESGKYDFLLSCHSLEHTANPIKALNEWYRVLRNDGYLILILPDKNYTFDHKRPYTSFNHLLDDYNKSVDEKDDTHFEEVLALHDLERDAALDSKESLSARVRKNFENRSLHHHVFDLPVIKQMLEYSNFTVELQQKVSSLHLITVARKCKKAE